MINPSDNEWQVALCPKPLTEGDVDLWRIDLDRSSESTESFFALLSDDEKARADRFVFAKDKKRFVTGRGMLRRIIGSYLQTSPETVRFSIGRFGKPSLSGKYCDLRFNISHSRGLAVFAISLKREVGVDIEFVDQDFDFSSVAASVFSPADLLRMSSRSSKALASEFFARWTRKEAFLKAMGDGLSSSDELQEAVSSLDDNDSLHRITAGGSVTDWSLKSFVIDREFNVSLVVEGKLRSVNFWQFERPHGEVDQRGKMLTRDRLPTVAGDAFNICAG